MIQNSPGILQFLDSKDQQLHRQFYAYGKVSPVLAGLNMVPPFQFIVEGQDFFTSFEIIELATGTGIDVLSGAQSVGLQNIVFASAPEPYTVFAFTGLAAIPGAVLDASDYYIRATTNLGGEYESEVFRMCSDLSKLSKITYCHAEDIFINGGRIIYSDPISSFKMFLYLDTAIGKPSYEYENQIEQRDGKNFFVQQIRYKVFRFEAIWPEHILDGFSLAPLHDSIKIESGGRTYDVDEMSIEVNWQEQGNLAAVTIEFRTQTVVVVNARAYGQAVSCDITPGSCFDVEYTAVAQILEGSAEYNGNYYVRESDGQQVNFQLGDVVLVESAVNGQVSAFGWSMPGAYNPLTTVSGQYVFEANRGIYWYDVGPLVTNEITDVTLAGPTVQGTAVAPGSVAIYGRRGDMSEFLLGFVDPLVFNGSGFDFVPPLCLRAVRMEVSNGVCGTYFSGDWFNLGPFDVHNVPFSYKNHFDAAQNGIEPGRLYAMTADNTLGLTEGVVLQLPPYDNGGYTSIEAGAAAVGNRCMFALSDNNIHGLPGGTLFINKTPLGLPPSYEDDAAAAAGGITLFQIYAYDALNQGFPAPLIKKRLS